MSSEQSKNLTSTIFSLQNFQTCNRFQTNPNCTDIKNTSPPLPTHPLSVDVSTVYVQQRTPLNGYQDVFP